VKGSYTNPDGEKYDVPHQAPAPAGSSVTNNSPSSGPPGTDTLPTDTTLWSAFWPLSQLGDTSSKFPPDLTAHGLTDNLYNPDGGFTPGDLGFPDERDNGFSHMEACYSL
jgi:hypothetical protein